MGAIQAWLPEGTNLAGLAAFLAAMVLSFLAGYLAGRSTRPSPARRDAHRHSPAAAAPRDGGPLCPLPSLDSDEARLMDLTAIREAETEPPPPIEPATRAADGPTPRDASSASPDQLGLPMAQRPGTVPRQRPMPRPDRKRA